MAVVERMRVRVRGIYATALTRLLMEEGFQIVQPSRVMAERLGIPPLELPPHVTVKSRDREPSEIVVIGYEGHAERVLSALQRRLRYSFYWVSKLPLYATVKAVVEELGGGCRARVGGVAAVVEPEPPGGCSRGAELVACVTRPGVKPREEPRLSPGACLLNDYVVVRRDPLGRGGVTVSEHVRGAELRAELVAAASWAAERGLRVHWRSSARSAPREELERSLKEAVERLERLEEEARGAAAGERLSRGETVAVVRLSSVDKAVLDEERAAAAPTVPLHHSVKSSWPGLGPVVDYAEKLLARGLGAEEARDALLELIAEAVAQRGRLEIRHVRPDGEVLRLGHARVSNVYAEKGRLVLVLERTVRSRGVYDGLGVEKEPGDRIVTEVDTSSWVVKHTYYSAGGELKGVYYNVNTPPEVGDGYVEYLDLEVDVVRPAGGEARVVDRERLEEAFRRGYISSAMYERALEEAERLAGGGS